MYKYWFAHPLPPRLLLAPLLEIRPSFILYLVPDREEMEKRSYLLKLFALFLMLSYLLSLSSAVPLSRNLALKNQNLPAAEIKNQVITINKGRNLGEEMARMDIEVNDYPGSGANPRHDPRSPGRA